MPEINPSKDIKIKKEDRLMFLIDCSALKAMFEGKDVDNNTTGGELLKRLNEARYAGADIKALSPLSSFLRAIYLCDPETKIGAIQKTLNFLDVAPSFADFKDDKAVTEEVLRFAKIISLVNKDKDGKQK